jgi:hypothetical protein
MLTVKVTLKQWMITTNNLKKENMKTYPEHEKLKKIQSKSQTIGEFLE